jgi:FkbM family methyltransferase
MFTAPSQTSGLTIAHGRHGTFATYAADQCIGESMRRYGEWAEEEIVLLSQFIPSDGVVLDIGAHIGTHSIAWAKNMGPNGYVIAIEGNPETFTILAFNVLANELFGRVRPINAIVGERPGTGTYAHNVLSGGDNYGSQTFTQEAQRAQDLTAADFVASVQAITVDSLMLKRCNVMKIDVEAMEGMVIRGALRTIESYRPVIYFEQVPGLEEKNLEVIFAQLKPLGYRLFWHVSNPFNPNNFLGDGHNIFGGTKELCVLCLPGGADAALPEITSSTDRFAG